MTDSHSNTIIIPTAHQMPPSGWQPGFSSCFQLSVRNTGPDTIVITHVSHEFMLDGKATGVEGESLCALHISPISANAWEHNPVFFPDDLASKASENQISLQITAFGTAAGKPVFGCCCMPVIIADLPEPLHRHIGAKTALELMPSHCARISNMPEILGFLDRAYDAMADLTGQRPLNGECMALRESPPFFAWARAGFPILLNTTHVRNSVEAFDRGVVCFGWLHEMGHNFEYGYWYMYNSPACEFHANFKLVYAVEHLINGNSNGFHLLEWEKNPDPERKYDNGRLWVDSKFNPDSCSYLSDTSREWESMGSNDLLVFYLALVRKYGWDPFKHMYRTYRSLSLATDERPTLNSSNEMFALQMAILSHLIDGDICAHCADWRIPLSEDALKSLSARFDLPVHTSHFCDC